MGIFLSLHSRYHHSSSSYSKATSTSLSSSPPVRRPCLIFSQFLIESKSIALDGRRCRYWYFNIFALGGGIGDFGYDIDIDNFALLGGGIGDFGIDIDMFALLGGGKDVSISIVTPQG